MYKAYQNLLESLKEKGHIIADYHSCDNACYPCILRHDIDNSLEKAVTFAELENRIEEPNIGTYSV